MPHRVDKKAADAKDTIARDGDRRPRRALVSLHQQIRVTSTRVQGEFPRLGDTDGIFERCPIDVSMQFHVRRDLSGAVPLVTRFETTPPLASPAGVDVIFGDACLAEPR